AIPLDASTRGIIDVLKRGAEVEYGFLGVQLQPPIQGNNNVRIARVSPGTPAQRAGLKGNDVIKRINGKKVNNNDDLFLLIGMNLAGGTGKVEVSRMNITRTYPVKLAKFYVPGPIIASQRPPAKFGLRVDYTSILSQRNPFPLWGKAVPDGVIVREVISGSP